MRGPAGSYLVVEFPSMHTLGLDFSARHPECVIDLATAPTPRQTGSGPALDCVVLVRGAGPALAELTQSVTQQYGTVRTLDHDQARDIWMGSLTIPVPSVSDPRVRRVVGWFLENGMDLWWIRIEEGRSFMRTQVPPGHGASELAAQLTGFLQGIGVEGDVAVETGSSAELEPWRTMVRRIRAHAG